MENLNKLSFKRYKIDEKQLFIPMNEIKQQFDISEDIKMYLFKLVYVHKYNSKTDTFTCYLSPIESTGLPIVKADIPIELTYIHKVIGGYDYKRRLEPNEALIINERNYRLIDAVNRGFMSAYLLCYGYMVNTYKNDDANTKITEGIQTFNITKLYKHKLYDKSYESYYLFNKSLRNILKIMLINKYPKLKLRHNKDTLEGYIRKIYTKAKFQKLPTKFFIDKE